MTERSQLLIKSAIYSYEAILHYAD